MSLREENIFNNPSEKKAAEADGVVLSLVSKNEVIFKQMADKDLWKNFQEGHEGAFEWIYDKYYDRLYNYGGQLTRKVDIEDAIQDFFIYLRMKRGRLWNVSNIKSYLLKCFRRRLIRAAKKKQFLVPGFQSGELNFEITFSHETQLVMAQFKEEQKISIAKALNKLSAREREVVYHYFFEDMDYKSIAEVMGFSSAKIARNLIYKSLTVLKKHKDLIPRQ